MSEYDVAVSTYQSYPAKWKLWRKHDNHGRQWLLQTPWLSLGYWYDIEIDRARWGFKLCK